jgi:uncharacterized membrane protein
MIDQKQIDLATIIIISIGLIFLGGAFNYIHNSNEDYASNPIYWSFGTVFSFTGGIIFIGIILKYILPASVYKELQDRRF